MKKVVLLLFAILLQVSAVGQEHLTFNGVPIDGTISQVVSGLKTKGFTVYQDFTSVYNGVIMKGSFTGKQAEIFILATPKSKTVWKIVAQFDEDESWSTLKSQYFKYKEMYTAKYGKPSDYYEFFSDPYYEGDGYELQALRKEKCTYVSFFDTEKGSIGIKIASSGCLALIYEDKINSEIKETEDNNTIMDDI